MDFFHSKMLKKGCRSHKIVEVGSLGSLGDIQIFSEFLKLIRFSPYLFKHVKKLDLEMLRI